MKKIIIIFNLFFCLSAYSQFDIQIGKSFKTIYKYYKEKGYNIQFYGNDKQGEKLNLIKDETIIIYYNPFYVVDKKNFCSTQDFIFNSKDGFYSLCDKLKIGDDYNPINEHKPVTIYIAPKLYNVYKFTSIDNLGKTIYCISISEKK